jgi:hypothetical protein
MSLSYRQQCQLRLIEADLLRSDPDLAAVMATFGRLYPGQDLPAWEDVTDEAPGTQGRLGRASAIVMALAATIAALTVLLGRAAMTIAGQRDPVRAPAGDRERTRPGGEADGPGRSQGR